MPRKLFRVRSPWWPKRCPKSNTILIAPNSITRVMQGRSEYKKKNAGNRKFGPNDIGIIRPGEPSQRIYFWMRSFQSSHQGKRSSQRDQAEASVPTCLPQLQLSRIDTDRARLPWLPLRRIRTADWAKLMHHSQTYRFRREIIPDWDPAFNPPITHDSARRGWVTKKP